MYWNQVELVLFEEIVSLVLVEIEVVAGCLGEKGFGDFPGDETHLVV